MARLTKVLSLGWPQCVCCFRVCWFHHCPTASCNPTVTIARLISLASVTDISTPTVFVAAKFRGGRYAVKQDAVIDSNLHPRCRRHMANLTKRYSVVFHSGLFGQLCENVMSSTKPKPKVHYISQCRQRMTDHGQCNMYRKFGETWSCDFLDMRADRQTDIQIR